jgi:hypothetical protein
MNYQGWDHFYSAKEERMIFHKMLVLLGLDAKKAIPGKAIEKGTSMKYPPSQLLAGFGAVTPKNRPEDFQMMREAFETGVARENAS